MVVGAIVGSSHEDLQLGKGEGGGGEKEERRFPRANRMSRSGARYARYAPRNRLPIFASTT